VKIGGIMKFQETLAFDDVLIVPAYSDIQSRSEVDISSHLDDNIAILGCKLGSIVKNV
jgi:IMP dehydrogenase/GMP reductase